MIVVLGYYDRANLGDESYKLAFPRLLSEFNLPVVFHDPRKLNCVPPEAHLVICGGGDIIENWFNEAFERLLSRCHCPVFAVSIGITYPSTITRKYLKYFQRIYVRHNDYSRELSTIVGTRNVYHIPDAAFILDPVPSPSEFPSEKVIGVFMAPTSKREDTPTVLTQTLLDLQKFGYRIVFYCFNTSPEKHEHDATYISKAYPQFTVDSSVTTVDGMLTVMSKLWLGICVRYHSHVFSILQNIPFVSLAQTPKAQMLMKDFGYTENVALKPCEINDAIRFALRNRLQIMLLNQKNVSLCKELLTSVKLFHPASVAELEKQSLSLLASGRTPESVVSHILYQVTGAFTNKYTHGFVEKLKANTHPLSDMIQWVNSDFNKTSSTDLPSPYYPHPYIGWFSKLNAESTVCLMQPPSVFANVHRSGWEFALTLLNSLNSDTGILCDTYTDGTFLWNETNLLDAGALPYKQAWCGFLHHTPIESCGKNNLISLFARPSFIKSLRQCKALITLSEYTQRWIKRTLKYQGIKVPVFSLKHPTETSGSLFCFDTFTTNPCVVQIGAWLRDPYAIYRIFTPWASRKVLHGPNMENYIHPPNLAVHDGTFCSRDICNVHCRSEHLTANYCCSCLPLDDTPSGCMTMSRIPFKSRNTCVNYILQYIWSTYSALPEKLCLSHDCPNIGNPKTNCIETVNDVIRVNYQFVQELPKLSNPDYDELLHKSVVFIKLEDASAVNTLIECMMRNTPILINRLEAVVEYLGPDYPLYYDHIEEIPFITMDMIKSANKYLRRMNKKDISVDTFIYGFKRILFEIQKTD